MHCISINASRMGCHISEVCINHVFYADDLCLMPPLCHSSARLHNICYRLIAIVLKLIY